MESWSVEINGVRHGVRISRSMFSGAEVRVDGRSVGRIPGDSLAFQVEGRSAVVQRRFGSQDEFELIVDGRSVPASDPALAPTAPALIAPGAMVRQAQVRAGASWFFWIAALSMVNAVLSLAGSDVGFIVGLGFIYFVHGAIEGLTDLSTTPVWALIPDALVAGLFALFGVWARRG